MSDHDLPRLHHIRAALKAVEALDLKGASISSVTESFLRLPTGGLYRFEDLLAGTKLLESVGLVIRERQRWTPKSELFDLVKLEERDACEVLLSLLLSRHPPLWFFAATRDDQVGEEFITNQDAITLRQGVPDPSRREALLLAAARRFDSDNREEIGSLGEEHIFQVSRRQLESIGREDLAAKVRRVSLISDQLGYDIVAPTLGTVSRRLEVKTTTRVGQDVEVYLSRCEAEVGQRDPEWALVICSVLAAGAVEVIGWCRGTLLQGQLPLDRNARCRWTSAWLKIPVTALSEGLPPYEV